MPKFLEEKIKTEYRAKGKKGKALAHAVYGTMNTIGAMHGNKVTAKGERMQAKHDSESHAYDWRNPPKRVGRPSRNQNGFHA